MFQILIEKDMGSSRRECRPGTCPFLWDFGINQDLKRKKNVKKY
jgi:hypothetical protein